MTVKLKSRVGPTSLTVRRYDPEKLQYTTTYVDFSLDNDCTDVVPEEWWDTHQEEFLDRSNNLKYKEAFEVRGYGRSIDSVHVG